MTDSHPPSAGNGRTSRLDRASRRRTIHRGLLAAAGALVPVLLVLLLWKAAQAVLLIFAGYLMSVFLRAPIPFLRGRTGLSHRAAFGIVLLVLAALLVALGFWTAPRVAEQADELSRQIPQAVEQLSGQLDRYEWSRWLQARIESGQQRMDGSWLSGALGVFSSVVGAVTGFVVVLWAGIYFAFDPRLYRRGLTALVPRRRRERVAEVFGEADETLRYWMLGMLASMTVVGILTWIGLSALGIPLAFILALLSALLTFIPNFGPIASTIPPALLALAQEPIKALWIVLLYLGIQTVESYLITPMIQKKAIEMQPALILMAQVVLALLFGFMGLVVAMPLAAALLVIVQRLYIEDVLEAEA